ncbi:hypothetical protein APY94_04140 [Thermococcus celericrescens]|uniref:Uncharacterized protein n=1 Tax=Thermococcus celericrescens TaxID=227598 RepID=A0A100XYQ0_9EURY|nr:hypothetical protein [Thermococcus celericrescens]KUH33928.1 hypothetical protein APY94_04140 [Thermococcus celericrescens]
MAAARAEMVRLSADAGKPIYKPFFDYMRRSLLDMENRYLFSDLIEYLFPGGFALYDVDSIAFDKESREPVAAFELKRKSWRVAQRAWENGMIEVNGYQFLRLKRLSRRFSVPLFYFIWAGEKFAVFKVDDVWADLERKYEGTSAEDLYAVIPLESVQVAEDFTELRRIMEGVLGR